MQSRHRAHVPGFGDPAPSTSLRAGLQNGRCVPHPGRRFTGVAQSEGRTTPPLPSARVGYEVAVATEPREWQDATFCPTNPEELKQR